MQQPKVELKIISTEGEEVSIVIKEKEITLNGVRYVPDPLQPNAVSIYLTRDNHTTIRIKGKTPKQVITEIKKCKLSDPDADTGTIFLLHDLKEIKRYGISTDNLQEIESILNKPEVASLLHFNF